MQTTIHHKPRTRAGNESLLRTHLLPTFGLTPLAKIPARPWYSTTLGALRRGQVEYVRRKRLPEGERLCDAWGRPEDDDQVVVDARWRFTGSGFLTNGDAWLALSAAARARERRRIAWEVKTSVGAYSGMAV